MAQGFFAAADGAGKEVIGDYPQQEVEGEEEGDVDEGAHPVVEEGYHEAGGYDDGHGQALAHA